MDTPNETTFDTLRAELEQAQREFGEWTTMSIHLGDGLYTRTPEPDLRLLRIVQAASDLIGKPLDQIRVLDLGCLEGHYGIEFALHGAEVVGLELREVNLAKAEFAKQRLGLARVDLRLEDVRDLRREVHGTFDLVICSGILYHLDVPDVFEFVQRIFEVCARMTIIDTQIALSPRATIHYGGNTYQGLWYVEHATGADRTTRLKDLWASVDNTRSFWFTHASLCNLIANAGFSSFYEVLSPYHHMVGDDRRTYVAIVGKRAEVVSSPPTDSFAVLHRPERNLIPTAEVQIEHGHVYRLAKKHVPGPIKDRIKPLLRAVGLLPPDRTPEWARKKTARASDRVGSDPERSPKQRTR